MPPPPDLEACLREHGGGLRQLARTLLGDSGADDAVQEVWVEALRTPPRQGGPLGGWLRTVLQHVAWRTRRTARRRLGRETAAADVRGGERTAPDPAAVLAREEQAHALLRAVHALEPACRDAIWQRYFEGLPPRAIAEAGGVPVATVKSRLARGLAQLRQRLHDSERAWRASLGAAFGLGHTTTATTTTTASLPGIWCMGAATKFGAAAVTAAIVFGLWWWFDGPAAPAPVAQTATEQTAVAPAPIEGPTRIAVTAAETTRDAPSVATPALGNAPATGVARVRGRLVDHATGAPLAAARVQWNHGSQLTARAEDPSTITAADGSFDVAVPADTSNLTFVASAPGYVNRWASAGSLHADQVDDLGTATLRRGRTFPVRIVDADTGAGVRGLLLELRYEHLRSQRWLENLASCESGEDGRCTSKALPATTVTVHVWQGDHELVGPTAIEVTADSPQELTVTVRPRATITGVVVDEHGAPLADIGLSTQGPLHAEVVTDARGAFTLVRRLPNHGAVTVSLVETRDHAPHAPLQGVPWGTRDLRVVLAPLPPFPIVVVDDTGAPVEQFAVALQRDGTSASRHALRQRGRHAGGRLDVAGVVPGATRLRVVPLDVQWAPSEGVDLGDERPVRIVVTRRVPCRVLVVRGETPVEDARVEFVHERVPLQVQHGTQLNDPRERTGPVAPMWPELVAAANTGEDGIASLWRDPTSAQRAVRVQVEGEPHLLVREPVFPQDGSPLRLQLPGSAVVRGRVLLAGRSHTDVTVSVVAGPYEPSVRLQPDGSFVTRRLPAGPCRVELLVRSGFVLTPLDGFARGLTLRAGEDAEVVFDLGTLVAGRVHGRVVGTSPLPAGLLVDLVRITTQGAATAGSATVAAGGTFAIEGLLPGTYHAAFRLPAPAVTFVPALQAEPIVLVGGENHACELQFARRKLTVHFVRSDGTPARGHRTLARCAGGVWPAPALFAPLLDETLVLDPAPALPVEFGGRTIWSEPVLAPTDRSEAEVTVVLPGS